MTLVHIYRASGPYIGQTRRYGRRRWDTVTKRHKTFDAAAVEAMRKLGKAKRMRVLMLDDWNEPVICFEGAR